MPQIRTLHLDRGRPDPVTQKAIACKAKTPQTTEIPNGTNAKGKRTQIAPCATSLIESAKAITAPTKAVAKVICWVMASFAKSICFSSRSIVWERSGLRLTPKNKAATLPCTSKGAFMKSARTGRPRFLDHPRKELLKIRDCPDKRFAHE